MADKKYVIYNATTENYWLQIGCGVTKDIEEAYKYSLSQAKIACNTAFDPGGQYYQEYIPPVDESHIDTYSTEIPGLLNTILVRKDHQCGGYVGETNEWSVFVEVDLINMEKKELKWKDLSAYYKTVEGANARKSFWQFIRPASPIGLKEQSESTNAQIQSNII